MMKTLLLVDDDLDLCALLSELIEGLKLARAFTAQSLHAIESLGESALQADLILLDINLGVDQPTGIDVYHWLVKNNYQGKIVFFTGHAKSHPLIQEAIKLPNTGLLEKPVAIEKIKALIESLEKSKGDSSETN